MPKVGQNIYKRNDGRWEGRLKTGNINGRTIYKSVYASSYTEVKEKLYSARISLSRKNPPADTSHISIKELFNHWLDGRKNDLKPSTVIRYENLFRYYIYDFFSRKNISEITTKDIEDLIGTLAKKRMVSGSYIPCNEQGKQKDFTFQRFIRLSVFSGMYQTFEGSVWF